MCLGINQTNMQKIISLVVLFIYVPFTYTQNTTISGVAPSYVGKTIELYGISDYFSNIEILIASSTVNDDSTFAFNANFEYTQKIIIHSDKNKGLMFVEPNAVYSVYFPKKNQYDPYKATGNSVEVAMNDAEVTALVTAWCTERSIS